MSDVKIEIQMDRKCIRCGRKGTAQNGLCLKCIGDRILGQLRAKKAEDEAAE